MVNEKKQKQITRTRWFTQYRAENTEVTTSETGCHTTRTLNSNVPRTIKLGHAKPALRPPMFSPFPPYLGGRRLFSSLLWRLKNEA